MDKIQPSDLIQLGSESSRYVSVSQYGEKIYVHVRAFLPSLNGDGTMTPMPTGAGMSISEWNNLDNGLSRIVNHQLETMEDPKFSKHDFSYEPIRLVHDGQFYIQVSRFHGVCRIHIRSFEMNAMKTRLFPTKKGIALKLDEWKILCDKVADVRNKIDMLLESSTSRQSDCKPVIDIVTVSTPESQPMKSWSSNPWWASKQSKHCPKISDKGLKQKHIVRRLEDEFEKESSPKKIKLEREQDGIDIVEYPLVIGNEIAESKQVEKSTGIEECEGCVMECGNQEAHYNGCLRHLERIADSEECEGCIMECGNQEAHYNGCLRHFHMNQ